MVPLAQRKPTLYQKKMNKYLLIACLFLFGMTLSFAYMYDKQHKETGRLGKNQTALLEDAKIYRLKDSASVAEIKLLKLTKSEFKNLFPEVRKKVIKNAGIRIKDVIGLNTTVIKTDVKIDVPLIVKDSMQCFEYKDKYTLISGCITPSNRFVGTFHSTDSIFGIQHIEKRKFWFIRWGIKSYKMTVVSKNPNSTIIFTESVAVID